MALSPEQMLKAKTEATSHLEYSISVLAAALGVDISTIEHPYEHDFPETDLMFKSHELLKKHVSNLEKLKAQLVMKPFETPFPPNVDETTDDDTTKVPETNLDELIVRYDPNSKQWFTQDENVLLICSAQMATYKDKTEDNQYASFM